MTDRAEMAERHGRMLARLAQMSLALAERLYEKAMAAESAAEMQSLSAAHHRMARSARQSMALEERLWRERARWERQDEVHVERRGQKRLSRKKAQVKTCVERLIWDEYEGDEAEALVEELETRIEEDALFDGFIEAPIEAHVARLAEELGLSSSPSAEREMEEVATRTWSGAAEGVRSDIAASPPAPVDDVLRAGLEGPAQSAPPTVPPRGEHLDDAAPDLDGGRAAPDSS